MQEKENARAWASSTGIPRTHWLASNSAPGRALKITTNVAVKGVTVARRANKVNDRKMKKWGDVHARKRQGVCRLKVSYAGPRCFSPIGTGL